MCHWEWRGLTVRQPRREKLGARRLLPVRARVVHDSDNDDIPCTSHSCGRRVAVESDVVKSADHD